MLQRSHGSALLQLLQCLMRERGLLHGLDRSGCCIHRLQWLEWQLLRTLERRLRRLLRTLGGLSLVRLLLALHLLRERRSGLP